MAGQQTHNRLHRHMINTVALEIDIEQALAQLSEAVSGHAQAEALFEEFCQMVKSQHEALEARLRSIISDVPDFDRTTTTTALSEVSQESDYPVSTSLQHLYTLFSQAIMAYTTLQPLTLRFHDGWASGEENSARIVRQHTINYVTALQKINQLIHDVVVWEMDQEGLECQCTCPSCGLGVCLCAAASRHLLGHAWTEVGPIVIDKAITVVPPKSASTAAKAGLRGGDKIIAVDGHELDMYSEIQDVVSSHKSGEHIALQVQRTSGERVDIAVEIP
jgi:hypothetical protein